MLEEALKPPGTAPSPQWRIAGAELKQKRFILLPGKHPTHQPRAKGTVRELEAWPCDFTAARPRCELRVLQLASRQAAPGGRQEEHRTARTREVCYESSSRATLLFGQHGVRTTSPRHCRRRNSVTSSISAQLPEAQEAAVPRGLCTASLAFTISTGSRNCSEEICSSQHCCWVLKHNKTLLPRCEGTGCRGTEPSPSPEHRPREPPPGRSLPCHGTGGSRSPSEKCPGLNHLPAQEMMNSGARERKKKRIQTNSSHF